MERSHAFLTASSVRAWFGLVGEGRGDVSGTCAGECGKILCAEMAADPFEQLRGQLGQRALGTRGRILRRCLRGGMNFSKRTRPCAAPSCAFVVFIIGLSWLTSI